jgi:hypothetical protein
MISLVGKFPPLSKGDSGGFCCYIQDAFDERITHPFIPSYRGEIIVLLLWLARQGSNLNFSDPESDVLPITPRANNFGVDPMRVELTASRVRF